MTAVPRCTTGCPTQGHAILVFPSRVPDPLDPLARHARPRHVRQVRLRPLPRVGNEGQTLGGERKRIGHDRPGSNRGRTAS